MESHCLRFTELPHTSKLFLDFVGSPARVERFYGQGAGADALRASARAVALPVETRRAMVEILREQNRHFGADSETSRHLDRLAAGAAAVVTGQQVGLFTGPAYSFYKALTAIYLARWLTETGTDAVPIFWLAAEDHDLAEVNHCYWSDGRRPLQRFELAAPENTAGRSVGRIPLGDSLPDVLKAAADSLPGEHSGWIESALRESCAPAETYSSSFGKLMARLLAGRGIILLDPLDPRLQQLASPIYRRAIQQHTALVRDLLARNKALDRAGYHAQVKVVENHTLLFLRVDGQRLPLRQRNGRFVAGTASFSTGELLGRIERSPGEFSANVLLRPVVQDSLLPTAVYVGGPAEVAYFAQAEVVYRALGARMPVVVPRASFTLVESPVTRLLKRYALAVSDVLRGRQHIRRRLEQQALPNNLAARFGQGERALRSLLQKLRAPLGKLDKTLLGALDTAERKMLYQFLKLRGKAGRSENLRTGLLDEHERVLLESLYPHRALQERHLCLLPFLARHGPPLLDQLDERCATREQHQVISL